MENSPRLTVIVPAFNEAARLSARADRFHVAVEEGVLSPSDMELIIVDDGSTDDTGRRAEQLFEATFPRLRVLRLHDNVGKGAAIRLGAAAATAPVMLFMDADLSVDPSEIPALVKAIGPADIAIGSRSLADSVVESNNLQRKVMGRTFNLLVNSLTGVPFRDTQCGFKAFRTPLARVLFHLMNVERFAFDVEVISLARRLRMEITEVAVRWREVGQSRVRTMSDSAKMTMDVLGVTRRHEWRNLPALSVTAAEGERRRSQSRIVAELVGALGPNFPILVVSEYKSLVLLPLCSPVEVQAIAQRLRSLPTSLAVRERSVSFSQLLELIPFKWFDDESGGFVLALPGDDFRIVTRKPVDGWETVRGTIPHGARSNRLNCDRSFQANETKRRHAPLERESRQIRSA
jgi:dolichyl-phosphate beta-glucosyltransferase